MAIEIIPANPTVKYDGFILPDQKNPYTPIPPDPNVDYNGSQLPQQAVKAVAPVIDQTNLPQLMVLGTIASVVSPFAGVVNALPPITGASLANGAIVMPADIKIDIDIKKIIGASTIIDGVEVTQHIRRRANIIAVEFTARALNGNQWIFAQDFLDALYQKILLPPTIIFVQNTMLNKIGITQLVFEEGKIETIRGNINIPIRLLFRESIPGKSLINQA